MTALGLQITPSANLGQSQYAWTFEIVTDSEQHHPNVVVKNASAAFKGTQKVDLEGNDIKKTKK
jgi:alpha-L-fucosidase